MNIFDLNHLEAVEGTDVVGGLSTYFNKSANIYINERLYVDKDVYSDVDLDDNLAVSEGDATAYGPDTIAQTFTATQTVNNHSSKASSTSISGSSDKDYYWYY